MVYLPLWKMEFVSWDDYIPNIWKNKKCSKPPTRYIKFNHSHMAIENHAFTSIFFHWTSPLRLGICSQIFHRNNTSLWLSYAFPLPHLMYHWPCAKPAAINRSTNCLSHIPIIPNHHKKLPLIILVGGIPTPLKNMSSSERIIIPTIGENKILVPNHQPNG